MNINHNQLNIQKNQVLNNKNIKKMYLQEVVIKINNNNNLKKLNSNNHNKNKFTNNRI